MNRTQSLTDGEIGLNLIGHRLADAGWNDVWHQHDFDELIYVLKGPVTCQTATQTKAIPTGQLLLIQKNTSHRMTTATAASFLYVGFHTNLTDLTDVYMQEVEPSCHDAVASLNRELDEVANAVFSQVTTFSECVPHVMAKLLPALLALGHPPKEPESKQLLSDHIRQGVQNNRHKSVRVEELAAGLYQTPQHVGNVFASVNGMTVKEFEYQDKMQQAPQVLFEESGSVAKAAARLGYESSQYFSKCFKNYYGISPSVFIKQKQKG